MKILTWSLLSDSEKQNALLRPSIRDNQSIAEKTQQIVNQVKQSGDGALAQLSVQLDGVALQTFKVSDSEFAAADTIDLAAKKAIQLAYENIVTFHRAQKQTPIRVETKPGVVCEKLWRPIQKVGLYIPGGTAPLVSTVLMLGGPAQVAENPVRILCTPPNRQGQINPHILYAAQLCQIDTIYKLGGAQAIAAMAYGTDSVLKVDKIFGPGNAWVTAAKQIVAQDANGASIDLPAGPSEVMVIADDTANPDFVAADLLSQAEHGEDSQVFLVCFSQTFAEAVQASIAKLLVQLSRKAIASAALEHSAAIVVDTIEVALTIANGYAPEHLIIQIKNPRDSLDKINCAGSIFLGPYTPESVGDYASGTNHVLPTYGYARNHSGLGVQDFMLHISVQELTPQGLQTIGPAVETLSAIEGLDAHGLAVTLRLQDMNHD